MTKSYGSSENAAWKHPPGGSVKINVDGVAKVQNKGAAAAVCRDLTGRYLGASAIVIFRLYLFFVE